MYLQRGEVARDLLVLLGLLLQPQTLLQLQLVALHLLAEEPLLRHLGDLHLQVALQLLLLLQHTARQRQRRAGTESVESGDSKWR